MSEPGGEGKELMKKSLISLAITMTATHISSDSAKVMAMPSGEKVHETLACSRNVWLHRLKRQDF